MTDKAEGAALKVKENGRPREKHRSGLSAAERKSLRSREAEEAIAEHESAQKAFHENRERLREERLRREEAVGPMLYPAPELPDHTPSRTSDLLRGSGMHSMLRE